MAKSDTVSISKINIKIGDKEVPLTVEQAKELHHVLAQLLGKPESIVAPIYPYPHVHYQFPYWQYGGWTVTSGSGSAGRLDDTKQYTVTLLSNAGGISWSQE